MVNDLRTFCRKFEDFLCITIRPWKVMSRARRDGTGNSEERDHFDDALRCLKSCETRFQEILSLLKEILIRFLVGGAVVSAFALVGDLLRPKSFAGLVGAAAAGALA